MSLLWVVCQDSPYIPIRLTLESARLSSLSSAHTVSLPHPTSPYLAVPSLIFRWIYLHLFTPSFPGLLSLNLHLSGSAWILAHITGSHSSPESEVGYSDPRTYLRGTDGTELSLSPNLLFQHWFHTLPASSSLWSFLFSLQLWLCLPSCSSIPNSSQQASLYSTFHSVFVNSFWTFLLFSCPHNAFLQSRMETTPKSWQKRSLATCLQPFFGFQPGLGQIQQWHCFTTHVNTSWLEVFLATLFSQQQCHPFSQGELGTCLCRQLSTFFLLIWKVVGASGMHVRSMTGLGYDLLSWPVQLLEPVNEKKCQGWRSRGVAP